MKEITNGSEKQIAWATEIRATTIKQLQREINELKMREVSPRFEMLIGKLENAITELSTTEKSAKFFIDNQNLAPAFIQNIKKH